jgi:hypothetical protein
MSTINCPNCDNNLSINSEVDNLGIPSVFYYCHDCDLKHVTILQVAMNSAAMGAKLEYYRVRR